MLMILYHNKCSFAHWRSGLPEEDTPYTRLYCVCGIPARYSGTPARRDISSRPRVQSRFSASCSGTPSFKIRRNHISRRGFRAGLPLPARVHRAPKSGGTTFPAKGPEQVFRFLFGYTELQSQAEPCFRFHPESVRAASFPIFSDPICGP